MDDRGFGSWQRLGIFLFATSSRPALDPTQPPIKSLRRALSLGVKRTGREADHSLRLGPSSRMQGAIPPLPQHGFMVWRSVKAQGQLYFYLIITLIIIVTIIIITIDPST
jgi:hypothetical protein